jgi:hypothetical protein
MLKEGKEEPFIKKSRPAKSPERPNRIISIFFR